MQVPNGKYSTLYAKLKKKSFFLLFFFFFLIYNINMLRGLNNEANFELSLFSWRNPKGEKNSALRL